jgi:NADPH2:quinone reductase
LRITEVPVPEPPSGSVLVRVAYCALNPLDTHARAGRIKWGVPSMPFTLGYEYAGRVERVAEGVDPSWVGRRVSVFGQWGGCGEFAVAPVQALNIVPEGLPWPEAAAYFTTTYTAWHLVHTAAKVQRGQVAVVHSAAGSVGVMLAQILKEVGARVIGLTSSREKASWAARFGVDDWVITTEQSLEVAVKDLTGGRGADVIFDGVQGPEAAKNLLCLAPFGRVYYIGAMGGPAPQVNVSQLIASSIGVHGFVVQHAMAATAGSETPLIDEALVSRRWVLALNRPRPLEAAGQAHAEFEARATTGRTLLEVGGDV